MAELLLAPICVLAGREEDALALLPPARAEKARKLKTQQTRCQSLAAGLLLCYRFGDAAAQIQANAHGKPVLPGGPAFSVSHGGEYAALMIADSACGVDIQAISPPRAGIERLFAPEEQSGGDPSRFTQRWTRKEALAKALGAGLTRVLLRQAVDEDVPPWRFSSWEIEGHWLSCALQETPPAQYTIVDPTRLL